MNKKFLLYSILAVIYSIVCLADSTIIEVEGQGKKVQIAIYDGIQKASSLNATKEEKKRIAEVVTRFLNDMNTNGPATENVDQDKIQKFIAELGIKIERCEVVSISSLPQNGYSAKMKLLINKNLADDRVAAETSVANKDMRKKIHIQVIVDTIPNEIYAYMATTEKANGYRNQDSQKATAMVAYGKYVQQQVQTSLGTLLASRFSQSGNFLATSTNSPVNTAVAANSNAIPSAPMVASVPVNTNGASYILKCHVKEFSIAPRQIQLPGYNAKIDKLQGCVAVDFSVLITPQLQVKLAESIVLHPDDLKITTLTEQSKINSLAINHLADIISRKVTQKMFPLLLVKILSNKEMILNQGGDAVHTGDLYKIYSLGDEIFDPVTDKLLGYIETEIGLARIQRVTETHCYAKLLTGKIEDVSFDTVFRYYTLPKTKPRINDEYNGELRPKKDPKKPWLQ